MIPSIATDPIEVDVLDSVPFTIRHGLGRQAAGWLVLWCDAPVALYATGAEVDPRQELELIPDASARVRLVLL
jgi:hypothetical protein